MISKQRKAIFFAVIAAILYSINSPISKLLLQKISPVMLAALLYLGAGVGIGISNFIQKKSGIALAEQPLSKKELPFVIMMVALDIAAPAFAMIGLSKTTASNASLLNNFEVAATSVIAFCIFKESISKRLWIGIGLVTLSSFLLSVKEIGNFSFSVGSAFILLSCICWSFENNCTRMISQKNPMQIVTIKGFSSGIGSLMIAMILGETKVSIGGALIALLLGFITYGLSLLFYVYAQRDLGTAKTSAYFSIAPFIGVLLSLLIFREIPSGSFLFAFLVMAAGTYFTSTDHLKISSPLKKR